MSGKVNILSGTGILHTIAGSAFTAFSAWSLWKALFYTTHFSFDSPDWFIVLSIFTAYMYLGLYREIIGCFTKIFSEGITAAFLLMAVLAVVVFTGFHWNWYAAAIVAGNGIAVVIYPVSGVRLPAFASGLRKNIVAKPLLILFCWIQLLFVFPLAINAIDLKQFSLLPPVAAFLGALAIWNDVKDVETDRMHQINTIAVSYNLNTVKYLSLFFMFGSLLMSLFLDGSPGIRAFQSSVVFSMFLLSFSRAWPANPLQFGLMVDALILLPSLIRVWFC